VIFRRKFPRSKKISRFITEESMKSLSFIKLTALALALVSLISAFSPSLAANAPSPFAEAAEKLYAFGIIDEAEAEAAKNGSEKKLDRHVFALWIARVLCREFEAEELFFEKIGGGTLSTDQSIKTGFADVDECTEPLYRKAIAYVSENGIFKGYGTYGGKKYFGPYREDGVPSHTEQGTKNGGKLELYQAIAAIIRLLSRAEGGLCTVYMDEAEKYEKYFGFAPGAYVWKGLSLGVIDKTYTLSCAEYSAEAELTCGEAAYLLERALFSAHLAVYAENGCADQNANGACDFCRAETLRIKPRSKICRGIISSASDRDGDGFLDADGRVEITLIRDCGSLTMVFGSQEFAAMATEDGGERLVRVSGEGAFAPGTEISMEYYGNILLLGKEKPTAQEASEIRCGFLSAAQKQDGGITVKPKASS
jgi:hypothetical protein